MSSTVKGNKVVFQNIPKSKYSKGNGRKFVGGITFQKNAERYEWKYLGRTVDGSI